jgi:subtilisin family serine protease
MSGKREFLVLRNLTRMNRVGDPFDRGVVVPEVARAQSARAAPPPEPALERLELSSREVHQLAEERGVVRVAPIMRTVLIRPFDGAGTADASAAWGVTAVGADASPADGQGAVVAVLDTGIDRTHAAFAGMDIVEQDFSGAGNGDRQGHGTHCAGTIFGRDVDGTRIGVARGVQKALIGKVLADDGSGDSEMIFRAISWAAEQGAHVVSMSLGFDFPGSVASLQQQGWPSELAASAVLEAYRGNLRMFDALMDMVRAREGFGGEGTVVVAAAGNESRVDQNPEFKIAASLPAAAEGVISVAALGQGQAGLVMAPFSNVFPQISGPGVNIVSAQAGGGLRPLNGTSMACPHVAGCAALWHQFLKSQGSVAPTASNVISRLLANAVVEPLADDIPISDRGVGLVRAPG